MEQITVMGINSRETVVIRIDVVKELVEAYLRKIPNEQRTLPMSLQVLRLHDDLAKIVKAEHDAAGEYIERKTVEELAKGMKEESDVLSQG